MWATRKLAVGATDNGVLPPAKSIGVRAGNWLSVKQAQALLNAPDITTLRHARLWTASV